MKELDIKDLEVVSGGNNYIERYDALMNARAVLRNAGFSNSMITSSFAANMTPQQISDRANMMLDKSNKEQLEQDTNQTKNADSDPDTKTN